MKSVYSVRSNGWHVAIAVWGMLAVFAAMAFGQQEGAPKPLLDSRLSALLLSFDGSKLSRDARRTFDVLTLIIDDADKATTADERNGYLKEFLARSQDFVREHPSSLPLWTLRAVAALEVNQAATGREACQHMVAMKAAEMDDPRIRRVLALLDRRGWFSADVPEGSGVSVPQARPALDQAQTKPAAIEPNNPHAIRIEIVECNSKWSGYGAYLHKMMESIQVEWDRALSEGKIKPQSGGYVTVKFRLDWKGSIAEVLNVESSSNDQGKQSCVTAITMASPYGEWTDNMIANLGNSQELTFRFNYE
jgi:hypothetical protein